MYMDGKGELAARCLWPSSITLTQEGNIICGGSGAVSGSTGCWRRIR